MSKCDLSRSALAAAIFVIAISTLVSGQDGLQFNVPYLCPDGSTYVMQKCEKGPKFEACNFLRDGNAQYSTRADMTERMSHCKLNGTTSHAAAATAEQSSELQNSRWECGGGASMTVFQCQKQGAQDYCFVRIEANGTFVTQAPLPRSAIASKVSSCKALPQFNPPYLAEFPSAYRVVQGMNVGNPVDNIRRAIGAFYQLSEIINVLAGQRASRGYLPDEKKFLDDYSRIQAKLAQAGEEKFPGQQFNVATNPYRFSRTDSRFGFQGIPVWTTFLSPGLQAQFAQMVGGSNPTYSAKIQEERQRAIKGVQTDAEAAEAESKPMRQDKGSVAMRKCMESGRSDMECLGEGMKVGLVDLAGGNPLAGLVPGVSPGLRLSGVYSAGNFSLGFDQSAANIGCGTLVPQSLPYSIERTASQLLIKVPISPKPLVLSYRTDGKLAGPGPIDVAGRVVIGGMTSTTSTGYQAQSETTTQQRQIDAAEAQNYIGTDAVHQNGMEYSVDQPVTTTTYNAVPVQHYTVPTAPKTERCNAALLPPTGSNMKISDALTQILGTQASKAANTAPGLRLIGTYGTQGGLQIEFRDDSATVECGEAHAAEVYSLLPAGATFAVRLQNGSTPFTLALQPNGTLVGSGTVDVAGRRLIRSTNDDVHNFAPVNARCTVGTLTAQSGK